MPETDHYDISIEPPIVEVNRMAVITLTAKDASDATIVDTTDTIYWQSTDGAATAGYGFPGVFAFDEGSLTTDLISYGNGVCKQEVIFPTIGTWTLTATSATNVDVMGTVEITVIAAVPPYAISHHLARGIHPGAVCSFMSPPNPVQGQLWIDVSASEPYPLKLYVGGTWRLVGNVSGLIVDGEPDSLDILIYNGDTGTWQPVSLDALLGSDRLLPPVDFDTGVIVKDTDGIHWLTTDYDGGNLIYYDGTRFQVLLRGVTGNILTVGDALDPQWSDPPPVVIPPIPVPPVTVPMGADVQVRCGVAQAMTDHLGSLYAQWSNWIAAGLSVLGAVAGAALVIFLDGFFAPLSPEITAIYLAIRPAIAVATSSFLSTALPGLTLDQHTALVNDIFCALTVTSGTCVPTVANRIDWQNAIEATGGPWSNDLQRDLLNAILQFTPQNDWLVAAAGSVQSSACNEMTCV